MATETLKNRTIETFLVGKMTSSIFDVTSFSMFFNKNASAGTINLKIDRIVDFDIKKPENKFQAGSAIFAEVMTL